MNFRALAGAFDSFLELLDFTVQIPAFGSPLLTGNIEILFELLPQLPGILELLFVLRLDLLDQLLGGGFRPSNSVQVDQLIFAFQLSAAHLRALAPGDPYSIQQPVGY